MKTYFKYGVMNSSKTASLLMVAHNYEQKGVKTYFLKSAKDTRDANIKARIGLEHKVDLLLGDSFSSELRALLVAAFEQDAVIFIDECQMLSYDLVKELVNYCMYLSTLKPKKNFNILAYGLLKDYKNKIWDGSRAWLEVADSIHEIKNVCKYCNRKATCNILNKKLAQKAEKDHNNVVIGDSIYESVCSYHYVKRGGTL